MITAASPRSAHGDAADSRRETARACRGKTRAREDGYPQRYPMGVNLDCCGLGIAGCGDD